MELYLPPTPVGDAGYLDEHPFVSDPRDRDSLNLPVAIPLRDYLQANSNFLAESSCNSLSLHSYSSGRPVSYHWEVSIANPLLGPFTSISMPPMDIVEERDQDPVLSSNPARSDSEDGPDTHYINLYL